MASMHPHIQQLITAVDAEEKEQARRCQLDEQHTLRSLKAEGLALHPLTVTRRSFGYADYPEITFRLQYPAETGYFKDGAAIECFCAGEEPVKGILLSLDGRVGEFRLFAPDFPDWIEDDGVGIKLAPDQRTTTVMKTALRNLQHHKELFALFQQLHDGGAPIPGPGSQAHTVPDCKNTQLNQSQRQAITAILHNPQLLLVHGPPGTGKTTTLAEAIFQLVRAGEKVLVAAPSNTAVDNIAQALITQGLRILRVGNTGKVHPAVFPHTPEGRLSTSQYQKEIKALKIRAEQFRKMALKYKRSFGKAEREQRSLLFKEVKDIRAEIKKIQAYNEEKLYTDAQVILGTPIGLYDAALQHLHFHTLVIDEAGQCIEPLAWCIFPLAQRYVLAGDHLQLPPTVLSQQAIQLGLSRSLLEVCMGRVAQSWLLNTQYRMRAAIAAFSGSYFYGGQLLTPPHLANTGTHLVFIDTAGSGFSESSGSQGTSLQNEGELRLALHLLQAEAINPARTAFISPYAGQAAAAKEMLPAAMRISTIDSFQGQEQETIIVSLVRSNDDGDIGFLKDYRRMNVAITRAQEKLYVIGDSATIGADPFYSAFLTTVEQHGTYRSVWEFDM